MIPVRRSHPELARLSQDFFALRHSIDPFNATMLGVAGFDDQVPDPSRAAAAGNARRVAAIEQAAARLDPSTLDEDDATDREVLVALAGADRADLEQGSWEANASADGYGSPQGEAFMAVTAASLVDAAASRVICAGSVRSGHSSTLSAGATARRQRMAGGRRLWACTKRSSSCVAT